MTFEELRRDTRTITEESIETLRADLDAKQQATIESCKAYMDDVATQDGRIKAREAAYQEQLEKLQVLEKKQGAAVAQAVAKGKQSAADQAEAELDATDEKIAALKKKRALMSGAAAKGEPELYAKAKADMEAATAAAEEYRANLAALRDAIEQEKERLEKMSDRLRFMLFGPIQYPSSTNFAAAAQSAFTKVDRHYKDLDRIEAEAAQKAKEQRKAEEAERARRSNCHVLA